MCEQPRPKTLCYGIRTILLQFQYLYIILVSGKFIYHYYHQLFVIYLGFGVFGKFYGLINNFLMENLSMINKSHCDSVGEHK